MKFSIEKINKLMAGVIVVQLLAISAMAQAEEVGVAGVSDTAIAVDVIVNIDKTSLGFIVDTVAEVQDIREKDIEPPPAFKTEEGRTHFISGLGKIEDRVTILIDVERVLQQKELETIKKNIEGGK